MTFYESGQVFGSVDVIVDTEIVAGYDLDARGVRTHPCAGTDVTLGRRRDIRPDRRIEADRVALPSVVRRLVARPSGPPAVAAAYGGRQGNPVRLDASVWADVAVAAEGDVGARAWMRAHPDKVEVVACDDLGVDDDIDTAEDLARLVEGPRMEPHVIKSQP